MLRFRIFQTAISNSGLRSLVMRSRQHGHALCRLHICTQNRREPGRPRSGDQNPFCKFRRERGRREQRCVFFRAKESTKVSFAAPPRPGVANDVCNLSGAVSKLLFKLRDCTVTPNSSRSKCSVTHCNAARNARILHLMTGRFLNLDTVTSNRRD